MSEEKKIPLHRERLNLPDPTVASEAREKKHKQLIEDCRVTFSPSAGRRVLRYIFTQAGYKKSKIGGVPALGMGVLETTLYNCAREQLILELLQFIPEEVLRDVEFGTFSELEEQ